MTLVVLGSGAFGRALAHVTGARLLGRSKAPGVETDIAAGLAGADTILLAVSAQATRSVLEQWARLMPTGVPLVLAAKGIESGSGALQSEIAADLAPGHPLMALTGPSFAADMLAGLPTAVTLAADDLRRGEVVQARLAGPIFRPYLSDDLVGAQIGGALKNVIAIACGAAMGRGLGASARAALMTRGFAEMSRISVACGGRAETLAGLSGFGDLALSCASEQSRNFSFGVALGEGRKPAEGVTYEGAATAGAALSMAQRFGVEVPIIAAVAALTAGEIDVDAAMASLLNRPLRREGA
ncbi:MAG: NAD(P)H-dependent glycerol-3-phosphate dehydrogenase [Pikeienuella sp.]